MKATFFVATFWCFVSLCTAALIPREVAFCSRKDVSILNKALQSVAQPATRFCASFLQISTPIPGTVSTTKTATTTQVSTAVVVASTTATNTVTATSVASTTVVSSAPGATSVVTTTASSFSAPPQLRKRGEPVPSCLKSVAQSIVSQVCTCFLGLPRPTATATATATAFSVVTASSTTTIPATATAFTTITSATTTTATGPVVVSTAVVTAITPVTYTRVRYDPQGSCVYNRYYDYPDVTNAPGPNGDYQPGRQQCQDLCTNNTRCKFWFFLKFDPNKARGFDGAACILDDQPYDSSLLQCGYVNSYDIAFNKN